MNFAVPEIGHEVVDLCESVGPDIGGKYVVQNASVPATRSFAVGNEMRFTRLCLTALTYTSQG